MRLLAIWAKQPVQPVHIAWNVEPVWVCGAQVPKKLPVHGNQPVHQIIYGQRQLNVGYSTQGS